MRAKALAIAFLITLPASVHAEVIAGWDFSQFENVGSLVIDGSGVPVDVLDSNYSALAPQPGVGPDAAFGVLFFNGLLGSTDVDETAQAPIFAPASPSLVSNLDAPAGCCLPFDSFVDLQNAGQPFANSLAMTATDAVTVVFDVDLSGVAQEASEFGLSFAARTDGSEAQLSIDWVTETVGSAGMATITAQDTAFDIPLGVGVSESVRVTLGFPAPGEGVGQIFLDNLAITATLPEPGSAGLAAALLCVAALGARRAGAA